MEELKPCPFCGNRNLKLVRKSILYKHKKAYVLSVRCNKCHARGGTITNLTIPYAIKEDVEDAAIRLWNMRRSEE